MPCRSRRPPPQKPPVKATYVMVFAALAVILLPTLLNAWLGHVPTLNLLP